MSDIWLQFLLTIDATFRVATPLILCAMAGIFSEKSGVIDISLEGKMLMAAFAAAAVASLTGSPWAGMLAAIGISVSLGLLHGVASITLRGNQVISGLAINILASGLTVTVGIAIFQQGGQTPNLARDERFRPVELPLTSVIDHVPFVGTIYREVISGHNILVWTGLAAVVFTALVINRTRFGLRLRAVGEKPEALDSAGVSVAKTRYQALIIAGVLCGMAGAYLSTAHGSGFVREMTAGKGYIALAAMIFGKWQPRGALLACLLFGFLEAVASRLQGITLPLIGEAPVDLILALPYLLTVILLAGFVGRAMPPRAVGEPYIKER